MSHTSSEYDEDLTSSDEETNSGYAIEEVFNREHVKPRIDLSAESRFQTTAPPVDPSYLEGDPGTLRGPRDALHGAVCIHRPSQAFQSFLHLFSFFDIFLFSFSLFSSLLPEIGREGEGNQGTSMYKGSVILNL